MPLRTLISTLSLLCILFIGCGKSENSNYPSPNTIVGNQNQKKSNDFVLQKLVKNANLRFRTANAEDTYKIIIDLIQKSGASITSENNFNTDSQSGFDLTIKVPADKFDSLVNLIIENANIKQLDNKFIV